MKTFCMRRLATLFFAALLAGTSVLAGASAPAAQAEADGSAAPRRPPNRVRRVKVTRDILFPMVGRTRVVNGFGDCRDNCTREHHGNDILNYRWKGMPVVAAHDGVISDIRDDGEWCNIEVTGADGWYTRYIHMNNDTPGYDDEDYLCIPPGLTEGSPVKAGQLIGWVGDSGNSEDTQPHIHFEIRMPSGLPVDPYASLKAARRINVRQIGSGDPAAAAARIARYAYPEGAPTVTVMSIDDYAAMLADGYAPLLLDGPLLLSEWETIPEVTVQALEALDPARVELVGDLWLPDILHQFDGVAIHSVDRLMERAVADTFDDEPRAVVMSEGLDKETEGYDDGISSVLAVAESESERAAAPFSLVLLGDRDELDEEVDMALRSLTADVAVTVMDFVDPNGDLGYGAFEGIGETGRRTTLYYATTDGWSGYRATEAPEQSPGYGWFVVDPANLTAETLTFFASLAEAPVMPMWR